MRGELLMQFSMRESLLLVMGYWLWTIGYGKVGLALGNSLRDFALVEKINRQKYRAKIQFLSSLG